MSCGITEDEIQEQITLKEQTKKLDKSKCKRCAGQPYVVLQKKDVFCKLCFVEYCVQKYKSITGKSKLIKPEHKVLIAYSGGQSSTALLNLTLHCLQHENPATRVLMKPYLLYIDETSVLNCESKSKEYNNQIDELLAVYPMEKFYSKLEWYFADSKCYTKDRAAVDDRSDDAKDELHKMLDSLKSLTAKEEVLRRIKMNLIRRIAREEQMNFVFLGSNATRLSIQLLTDVAQGRGNQVDSEVCFLDSRDSAVPVLKPMREFVSKEIAFWNRLSNAAFVEIEDLLTKRSAKASIGKICEQFINYLQKDYPSTTYTIGKMVYKLENQNELKRCAFCQSPVDRMDENELSAQMALVITDGFGSKPKSTFNSDYCYSCNILLRESGQSEEFTNKIRESSSSE